jgi:hypothetical protein
LPELESLFPKILFAHANNDCGTTVEYMPTIMKNTSRLLRGINKNIVGPHIRQARLRSQPRLTQQKLADRVLSLGAHIDRAGIAKIEIGLRRVCDFELFVLAKALNVSVALLLPMRSPLRR